MGDRFFKKIILAVFAAAISISATQAGTIRVRAFGEPQTLDWNKATTWLESLLIRNLMEGLVTIDSNLKPAPGLATHWTISNGGKTYTFTIQKNIHWSDGRPLKANDFVASWKRLLAPQTKSRYAFLLFDIENAENFNQDKIHDFSKVGVKALNDETLEVRLRDPVPFWIWIPTSYSTFPIREDLIEKNPSGWEKPGTLVSLGAYQLKSSDPGRSFLLEKNKSYHRKSGNIDQVQIALIHDDTTAIKLYEVGQLDFLAKIPSLERKRFKNRADFHTWPDLRVVHLRLNTASGPLANIAVRKAISMSINRRKIEQVFEGGYMPASSFVPKGILGYSPSGGAEFNPAKAKEILKKAGIDPLTLPPLDLLTVAFDDQILLAQFVQDELRSNLGLNVRTHVLEPKRYYSPILNHTDYAMQINFWGADFPDPDSFYSIFLSDSGLNRYHWKNKQYDDDVRSARISSDRKTREKLYKKIQKNLLEDEAVTVPMYYGQIHGLIRKSIKGFNPNMMNWWVFKEWSL